MVKQYIDDDAPFNEEQRAYLNQLVDRIVGDLATERDPSLATNPAEPVKILFGTQTGNSETLSKRVAKVLVKNQVAATVVDMLDFDHDLVSVEQNLLIITSTYGEGEPPDNAEDFLEFLFSEQAPKLPNLRYSVLALGDTEYPDFCKCGIQFDERLAALGATRLVDRVDCDVDFDEPFNQWKDAVVAALAPTTVVEASRDNESEEPQLTHSAPILRNFNLNSSKSNRETHHVELSLEGSHLEYEVGDALSVQPLNPEHTVDQIIEALPFDTSEPVPLPDNLGEASLRDALTKYYDIRSLSKKLIKQWQERSGSPFLRSLVQANSNEEFEKFIWGRELIDLVLDFPADFEDGESFVSLLKKLQPRLYSIASSPKAHPGEVHLTVAIVRYHSHHRNRGGVCSTFFSDRSNGVKPAISVHRNNAFRLPSDPTKPIIMCGPGTGIAPFRAFLEARRLESARGMNWLFFGNPHQKTDYLYEHEFAEMVEDGTLTRLDTAFSRDQSEKVYVQHRMLENGAEIWRWLNDEQAHFYVCGDANRMAKDVDAALHKIVEEHGDLSEADAKQYVKSLKKQKRYSRDVY